MKPTDRAELLGLGVFTALLIIFFPSVQSTMAASQTPGAGCTVSFSGTLASLQLAPAGRWGVVSSSCDVTGQSNGTRSGTFTGAFTSALVNETVSGTWTQVGSVQAVQASSTQVSLSISVDQAVGGTPGLGSAYQGIFSGPDGQTMLTVGTTGQIVLN